MFSSLQKSTNGSSTAVLNATSQQPYPKQLGKLNSIPQTADCPSSPSDQPLSSQQRGEDSDPCWTPPSNPNRSGLHTRPIRHPELRKYYLMGLGNQGGSLGEFGGRENLEEGYVNVGAGVLGSAATFCCGGGGAEGSGKGIRMEKVKAGGNEKENALLDKQFKRDPQQDRGSILPTSPPPPDSCLSLLLGRKLSAEDKNIWQECLTGPQETLAHSQTAWAAMDSGQGLGNQGGSLGEFGGRENLEEGYVSVGAGVLGSAATFCCGGGGAEGSGKGIRMEKVKAGGNEKENALLDKQFKRVIRSPFFVTSPGPSKQPAARSALRFLRLRLQVPLKRKSVFSPEHRADKRQQSRDVWFTLTQDKSDELYAYLSYWRPDLYIMEGGGDEEEEEFVLVDDEEEISPTENHSAPHVLEDWEIISVDDGGGEQAKEPEALTDILEQSNIMEESHIRELSSHLPPRILIHSWQLAYSTSLHGSSLKTLYRKLSQRESPALLVIKDFHNQIFGCFVSHPLRLSDSFYGTGETFLFTFYPEFKCFHWTGENSFFIKGDLDSVAIGGGSGHFGLWLDKNLYLGRSSPCSTFDNNTLSETADFRVLELEVWNFY
ncbi:UNVERIFIED_CONTAM: hypothetical protein FKN15_048370 [Acipenser sinensis]